MTAGKTYMNWSGGKDSAYCLHKIRQNNKYQADLLLTNVNGVHNRISMHGVRRELLEAQAKAIGIPLETVELPEQPAMKEYEDLMEKKIAGLRKSGFTRSVFGDIFLEDLRNYRVRKLEGTGIEADFPLWQIPTPELMKDFLALGFKAVVVCINERYLDKNFCGRIIDEDFVNDLPSDVDVCGENGEYHSFVYDGPIFKNPIRFTRGELVRRTYPAPSTCTISGDRMDQACDYGFYFCDLLP